MNNHSEEVQILIPGGHIAQRLECMIWNQEAQVHVLILPLAGVH